MTFQPLEVLTSGEKFIWIAGAEHDTRSDGSSSLMVAQGYSSIHVWQAGQEFTDHLGQAWVLTDSVSPGFHLSGIILEAAETYQGITLREESND